MTEVRLYSDDLEHKWTEYANNAVHASIAHQIGFRDVIQTGLHAQPVYLMVFQGAKVTGILPIFLIKTWWQAKYIVSIPWLDYGGICADDVESEAALLGEAQRIAERENAQFVEFRSETKCRLDLATQAEKVTFLMDLRSGSDSIWKSFDAKLRNQIRRSQKSGLVVQFGGLDLLDDFYRVFCWKMRELGTPVWSKALFATILKRFPDTGEIVLVRQDQTPVCGALLLSYRNRQYIPSAAAYRKYLPMCPYHALYWSVIERAATGGFDYFDFGRSSVHSSTFKFKKQWVETPTPLEWQYSLHRAYEIPRINPGNPKYKLARTIWSRLPLPLANLLGPAVIRNFP